MIKIAGKRNSKTSHLSEEEKKERRRAQNRKQMAAAKAKETPAQKANRNRQNAVHKADVRANQTSEQITDRNRQNAAYMADVRANQTQEQIANRNRQNAAHMADVRANQTQEQIANRNRQNAAHMADVRANLTPGQITNRNHQNAAHMANVRNREKTQVEFKDAMRTHEILNGTYIVKPLQETADNIGQMTVECPHCKAIKFPGETPSSCCLEGKVKLPHYPQPPDSIMQLWSGNDERSQVMRKLSRTLNNAVGLASIKNHAPRREGWCPTVILQGKVVTRAGPLLPENGERPQYSQLYIQDPSLELTIRYNNMTIPQNTSEQDKLILREVLEIIQTTLHEVNPFVQDFKQIVEMPDEEIANGKIVICSKAPSGQHTRRYNPQTNLKEVSILTDTEPHDLILQKRGGGLHTVRDLHPKGMPLHFTLLFPYGTPGYDLELTQADSNRRVTPRQYFTFHLNIRNNATNYIFLAGRLFQEWLCMAWFLIENQRLEYQRNNQKALRADTYKSVQQMAQERNRDLAPRADGLYPDDNRRPTIGRKILSSSFTGGPRFWNGKFQDGMAIIREHHKPDFFITMTTNSKWPEIEKHLLQGQTAQDRPDIVSRVFHLKYKQLMKDLVAGGLFGEAAAHMLVIEWQKRGLPHAHILLILANHDRMVNAELVDSLVTAELPPDPNSAATESHRAELNRLEKIVLGNMTHGPCDQKGCLENGRCTKGYPKPFQKETVVNSDSFYATYRRRSPEDGGRTVTKGGRSIDNSWVVPYNVYLSLRYDCHINIEVCTSVKAAKYLNKYTTKGNDRARVGTQIEGEPIDEIKEYQDLRCVGSSEASWHIMGFEIAERYPSVQALRVHLKEQQQVTFDENTEEEALERCKDTELTAFFSYNESVPAEDRPTLPKYVDMPKSHVYDKSKKEWRIRQRGEVIGRVHIVHPVAGDAYNLRMLLHDDHCRGKTSFEDLLIVRGRQCETYKEVCLELGLLQDDREWQRILEEAAATSMCPQCRELYVMILMFCMPSNPRALFDEFWMTWTDDLEWRATRRNEIVLTEGQKRTLVLLDLADRLQSYEKQLSDLGLPIPSPEELQQVSHIVNTEAAVMREEMAFDITEQQEMVEERLPTFTQEQLEIYTVVMNAVTNNQELCMFIKAPGGHGKTHLLNTLLAAVRSSDGGSTALAMATTGIAANLLPLGRTFHSRCRAPLTPSADCTLQISAQSSLAELVRTTKLLMIDEATMLDRYLLEALHRTLQDLMGNDRPFGGKIVILAGDFRQCLPVVPGATRGETVSHCIKMSPLWRFFQVYELTVNMRVRALGDPRLQDFVDWSLSVGDGLMENLVVPDEMVSCIIPQNSPENPTSEGQAMEDFCGAIFPDLATNVNNSAWMEGRAILAVTNKEVNMINEILVAKLPGQVDILKSADQLDSQDLLRFNTEYLHTLCPNGFPTHDLRLKRNMPLMLLRNLNPKEGLCNGTKLTYLRCIDGKLLECRIVGSQRVVLIPRITLIPKVGEFPFEWQRRQFPVKPAFAYTINKSQGQTLKMAGIWLRTQVIYKVKSS